MTANAQVIADGCGRSLHPVEVPPLGHRRVPARLTKVVVELRLGHACVDLVTGGTPSSTEACRAWAPRLPRFPHAYDLLREHLGDGLAEHPVILPDQVITMPIDKVPSKLRRVLLAVLCAHLEADEL